MLTEEGGEVLAKKGHEASPRCSVSPASRDRPWHSGLWCQATRGAMAYKRLEDTTFTWPEITDGMMALNHAQFEALFSGLDWRKVKALDTRPPAAAE